MSVSIAAKGEKEPGRPAAPGLPGRMSRLERRNLRNGLLFISPWIVGFLAFTAYPFIASLFFSFTKYNIVSSPSLIGLSNYINLFHDPLFWKSIYNTFYYTVIEVPLSTVVAIAIALLLNLKIRGQAIYRTIFYLPSIVPAVASSVLWVWLFDPSFGVINDVLAQLGIKGPGWLFSTLWSKPTLILMGLWGIGGPIVIYLAGLQGIPNELYEAAAVDGASAWRRIRRITIPLLSPVILFNVILGVISSFQYFTQAYVMTSGGPDNSTEFYSLYLYDQAFEYLHMGYASAMAWILFVIILVITLVLFKLSKRWVFYG
jgi:multiple sugar transport system permease protein